MLTVSQIIRELRGKYPADHVLFLKFHDLAIQFRTNETRLIRALQYYFNPFISEKEENALLITAHQAEPPEFESEFLTKPPDPGKNRIKEEYFDLPDGRVVRKRLTSMIFIFGGDEHLAIGPCLANDNQVINFINNRLIAHMLEKGCLLGHAAGILLGKKGMAIAGVAGAGKSTLALKCVSLGASFVSNDRLLLERSDGGPLVMRGVPKLPRVNPGTVLNNPDLESVVPLEERRRFLELPASKLWDLEHKYDVPIGEVFGPDRFVLKAPVDAIVILNWRREKATPVIGRVDLSQRLELLEALIKSEGLFYIHSDASAPRDNTHQGYLDLLRGTETIEISGGVDFDVAASKCLEILK